MKLAPFLIIFSHLLVSCNLFKPDISQQASTASSPLAISVTNQSLQSATPKLAPNHAITNTITISPSTVTPSPKDIEIATTFSPTLATIGELYLKNYGLALSYRTDIWQFGEDDIKRGLLQHNSISNCRIREWGPSEVYGDYLNTVKLGKITYQIWGWANSETGERVRHYLARSGFDNPSEPDIPDIEVVLPYVNNKQCALEASEVLATLHVP